MQTVLEQGSIHKPLTFDVGLISYQSDHLIHATFQSNCAEGLHFSAFSLYYCIIDLLCIIIDLLCIIDLLSVTILYIYEE